MKHIVDKYTRAPFEYGLTDCCRFAGECTEAMTGKNIAARFGYSNEQEANDLIASYGSLEKLMDDELGDEVSGEYEPKDGDVALCKTTAGFELVGVVYRGVLIVLTKTGVMDWPLSRAYKVWAT